MILFQRVIPCPSGISLLWDAFSAFDSIDGSGHLPSDSDNATFESAVHSVLIRGGGYQQHCSRLLWVADVSCQSRGGNEFHS